MDKQGQTDRPELEAPWIPVAKAAKLLGKTERTVRRYVNGEVSTPSGVETRIQDGLMQVRISGRTDSDGRKSKSVHKDIEDLKQRADMSEREVVRLRTVLDGKEELLKSKEQAIRSYVERAESDAKTIYAMEALTGQLQLQASRKDTAGEDSKKRQPLWLTVLFWLMIAAIAIGAAFWIRGIQIDNETSATRTNFLRSPDAHSLILRG